MRYLCLYRTPIGWMAIVLLFSIGSASAQNETAAVSEASTTIVYPQMRFWCTPPLATSTGVWESPMAELLTGSILDINEQEIVYRTDTDSTPSRLPSARLQAVDVVWGTAIAEKAHAAYLRDDYPSAISFSKTAIAEGKLPRWQQRILAAEITDCLSSLGQINNACRVFISLCKESPAPMLYASAPLNWTSERVETGLEAQAQEWIKTEASPIAQLLGASWLLIGNESNAAREVLTRLSRSPSTALSQLATAQLWRMAVPSLVLEQYRDWAGQRDRLLLPLQIGPTMTIAHKLERAGRAEEALQEWLRMVTLFSENRKEVRHARASAIELLQGLGRIEESNALSAAPKPGLSSKKFSNRAAGRE